MAYQRVSGQESKSSTTREQLLALYGVKDVGESPQYKTPRCPSNLDVVDLALEESSRKEDKPTKQGRFNIAMMRAMSGKQFLLGPTRTKACHAMLDGLHKAPAQLDLREVIICWLCISGRTRGSVFLFSNQCAFPIGSGFLFQVHISWPDASCPIPSSRGQHWLLLARQSPLCRHSVPWRWSPGTRGRGGSHPPRVASR